VVNGWIQSYLFPRPFVPSRKGRGKGTFYESINSDKFIFQLGAYRETVLCVNTFLKATAALSAFQVGVGEENRLHNVAPRRQRSSARQRSAGDNGIVHVFSMTQMKKAKKGCHRVRRQFAVSEGKTVDRAACDPIEERQWI